MVSLEDIQKAIKWLRDTTNENIIYIDKDLKRELGNAINDLLKLNEIYKSKIDKAIDFIDSWEKYKKENKPLEVSMLDLLYIKDILGDKENE